MDVVQGLAVVVVTPFAVLFIGSLFTYCQSRSQQEAEERRAQAQLDAEEQRAQDEALQAYLEEMGNLLLEEDLRSPEGGAESRTLAEARTRRDKDISGGTHINGAIAG